MTRIGLKERAQKVLHTLAHMDKRTFLYASGAFVVITVVFFAFKAYFSPDSSEYYYLSCIFDGTVPFSEWYPVRGFSFPFFLFLSAKIFGNTPFGIQMGLYLLNLSLHILSFLILKRVIRQEHWERHRGKIYLLYLLLLALNPIIIGYSHTVLTESMAPTLALLSVYLALGWYRQPNGFNLKKVWYVLGFSAVMILTWFLKQPYLPLICFVLFLAVLCSLIRNHTKFNIWYRIVSFFACFALLIGSMLIWNAVLDRAGLNTEKAESFAPESIFNSLNIYYRRETAYQKDRYFVATSLLPQADKDAILAKIDAGEPCNDYRIYNIYGFDKTTLIDQKACVFSGDKLQTMDAVRFLLREMVDNPRLVVDCYYSNYMAAIGLHSNMTDNQYIAGTQFVSSEGENRSLAMYIFSEGPSYWWRFYLNDHTYEEYMEKPYAKYMTQFEVEKEVPRPVTAIAETVYPGYSLLFKFSFLLCPFIALYAFVQFCRHREKETYFLLTILFGASFVHTLFHAMTGQIIDRYVYMAFPMLLIGWIVLLIPKAAVPRLAGEEAAVGQGEAAEAAIESGAPAPADNEEALPEETETEPEPDQGEEHT